MSYDSFSAFLAALERAGELRRIALPVATELEITELADREMKSPGGGKALLFEQPTVNGAAVQSSRSRSIPWARIGAWRWRSGSSP